MSLKTKFVVKIEHHKEPTLIAGRDKDVVVPVGLLHIVEVWEFREKVKGVERVKLEPSAWLMCGKTRAQIGEETQDLDKRPAGLALCPECEAKYKAHPQGPWGKWVTAAVSILVLFLTLACLSPSVVASTATASPTVELVGTPETAVLQVDPASTETAVLATAAPACVRVMAESLHVRDVPGVAGQVIGYLYAGDVVRVHGWLDVDGVPWLRVGQGWSNGGWLESVPCP